MRKETVEQNARAARRFENIETHIIRESERVDKIEKRIAERQWREERLQECVDHFRDESEKAWLIGMINSILVGVIIATGLLLIVLR